MNKPASEIAEQRQTMELVYSTRQRPSVWRIILNSFLKCVIVSTTTVAAAIFVGVGVWLETGHVFLSLAVVLIMLQMSESFTTHRMIVSDLRDYDIELETIYRCTEALLNEFEKLEEGRQTKPEDN